jgi:hypothetical protein
MWVPLQIWMAKGLARARGATAVRTDVRVRHVSEIIESISSVKAFAWELPFYQVPSLPVDVSKHSLFSYILFLVL